jgi:hypothetical protein
MSTDNETNQPPAPVPHHDARPKNQPTPPSGYTLIRYDVAPDGRSGNYTPPISAAAFSSLKVWIPDLGAWMKPKFIVGDEARWFAVKQR